MDFATSENPSVQAQLDRLGALAVPGGRLGLGTIRDLLERLGDPHRNLPPVFHVAGTNGKGSTCAFLRAMLEADGKRVHVTTSPHLVRYNERIRLAGKLIEDDVLAALLEEVLDTGEDLSPSFFEVTIATAFLAFSRTPADVCVVEVGLGGRFDATNVLESEAIAACGIAALGIDHERFLLAPEDGAPGDPLSRIAFEKSGIAKNGSSLVTLSYADGPTLEIERAAAKHGATLAMRGREWSATVSETALHYTDRHGELALPLPIMLGVHQAENAALAAAMLRHQDVVIVSPDAIAKGIRSAHWPARLQRFSNGKLGEIDFVFDFWLDGGHNLQAARAIRLTIESDPDVIRQLPKGFGVNVILGMLANKDAEGFIAEIAPIARRFVAVPVPGHDHHSTVSLERMARAAGIETVHSADDVLGALNLLNTERPGDGWKPTAIIGSLYLAGEVLRLNGTLPD